jgi:hypothetical protein
MQRDGGLRATLHRQVRRPPSDAHDDVPLAATAWVIA